MYVHIHIHVMIILVVISIHEINDIFVPKLVCEFYSLSLQQCINASQAVCDMIRISRDSSQTSGPSPLLTALER